MKMLLQLAERFQFLIYVPVFIFVLSFDFRSNSPTNPIFQISVSQLMQEEEQQSFRI